VDERHAPVLAAGGVGDATPGIGIGEVVKVAEPSAAAG